VPGLGHHRIMDKKLIDDTERLLKRNLESLLLALRNKRELKESKTQSVLEFIFTNEEVLKSFLEEAGRIGDG
jgi:hypothetical protein